MSIGIRIAASQEKGDRMVSGKLVGRVLRKFRESKGMSQEVLSGLAGLDRTHYSKIERGLRNPTIDTFFKIAYALDVQPHIIIKAIEQEPEIEAPL